MPTRNNTAPAVPQSVDASPDIQRTIAEALELLGRASADWKNGTDAVPGPLHWPVAVNLARRRCARRSRRWRPSETPPRR